MNLFSENKLDYRTEKAFCDMAQLARLSPSSLPVYHNLYNHEKL